MDGVAWGRGGGGRLTAPILQPPATRAPDSRHEAGTLAGGGHVDISIHPHGPRGLLQGLPGTLAGERRRRINKLLGYPEDSCRLY